MSYKRTHHCNELTAADIGKSVSLCGWVNSSRNLGGMIFLDLRDREGITQLFIDPAKTPDIATTAKDIREEWVVAVDGLVRPRPADMANRSRATGAIEVEVTALQVLNRARPMPYHLEDATVSEDMKLKYRYLDMRRSGVIDNLRLRHKMAKIIHQIFDEHGFIEVETPILSKSTPEGARDYLVPSRVRPGNFFALPQSPQQYKQLLMVGGIERYYQIARCFRDEDLRADRQPEFTQIDLEMSFVDQDDIIAVVEHLIAAVVREVRGVEIKLPFDRMTWHDAMETYGSDKPDRRFGMELKTLTPVFAQTAFKPFAETIAAGGAIRGFNAKGQAAASSRKVLDELTATARLFGAKGLVWLKVEDGGHIAGSAAKFLSEAEASGLASALDAAAGDLLLLVADTWRVASEALGRLRLDMAERAGLIDPDALNFLWVVEFPLLEWDEEEKRFVAVHHPFTHPMPEDLPLLQTSPGDVRAQAYDIVLNGVELGGGSIRIHESDLQATMFKALGISDEQAKLRFGHLLEAFSYGAPPHGGLALGFDRFVMLMCKAKSIREVIAFPKTAKACCLLMDSPSDVEAKQLDELHISLKTDNCKE